MIDAHSHSQRRRRWLAGPVVLTAATLAVAACGSSSSTKSTPKTSAAGTAAAAATSAVDTLKIANAVAVDTLDPEVSSANESIWLDQNLYSRLVKTDPGGTKIEPDLASSYDTSTDGLTYTFHLRQAKFSDGSPITAADVVYSFKRARAYDGGWGFLVTPVTDVTAPDASTVVFTLKEKHAPMLADLAMYAFSVLPQKAVEADKQFFTHPITSGPFTVSHYDANALVTLTANPDYYGTKPKIKTVDISIVTSDNTRVLQLQAGTVDVIENPPGNLLKQIGANPKLKVDLFPSTRVDFMQLPLKTKPFDNEKVRQAVHKALDLTEMNNLAYQGNARVANSFFPYQMLDWNGSLKPASVDVAGAKALLAQAGMPNGFATNLITVSGDAAGQSQAIVVKDDLAKIGINVTIQSYDLSTAYAKEKTGTGGMGLRYWTNDIIDPDEITTFAADVTAGSSSFDTFWSDPTATGLVNKARSESDPTARAAEYGQIQQIVSDQAPYVPLAYPPYRYANGSWVKGFAVSPLGNYNDSLLSLTVDKH